MELRHLRYFTAVVDFKGYREASRHLHIAQPALTQTVLDLEQELGSKLFVREPNNLTLTPSGKAFYAGAKETLKTAEQAMVAAKRAAVGVTGSLTIGFIPGSTQHFLPDLLTAFRQDHPWVELHIRELAPAPQMEALLRGELDLAFTREASAEQRRTLTSRWLFDVPLIVVLPVSRHMDADTIDVASLTQEQFNLIGRDQSPVLFDSIVDLCRGAGFSPKVNSLADLSESMYTLVQAGEGISIAPMWTRVFMPHDLQSYRLSPDTVRVELVAAWKTSSSSVTLKSFVALLDSAADDIRRRSDREFSSPSDRAFVSV